MRSLFECQEFSVEGQKVDSQASSATASSMCTKNNTFLKAFNGVGVEEGEIPWEIYKFLCRKSSATELL